MSCSNVIRGAAGLLGVLLAAQSMAATPEELVCRDLPRPGSRIVMHVCASQLDWAAGQQRKTADLRVLPPGSWLPPVFATAFPHELGASMTPVSVDPNR